MSIFWRKIEKSLDGCPIRNAENRQIEQFREKERTAPPGEVELLQSVDFYGILICRKGAVLQVQRSCFPSWGHRCVVPLEEVQFFVALRGYECFYTWVTQGGIPLWKFGIMFSPCSPFWSLSSLARPRSLGRLPKRFFVTRTAQNTIRKNNDKKHDRLGSQSDGGHVF